MFSLMSQARNTRLELSSHSLVERASDVVDPFPNRDVMTVMAYLGRGSFARPAFSLFA